MASVSRELTKLRESLAEEEIPILNAIKARIKSPVNERLYAEVPFVGVSRFDLQLYPLEFARALEGSYKNGERPLSLFWLPRNHISGTDVTSNIRAGYFKFLEQCCPRGNDSRTYHSSFRADLDALWFLSKRIHRAGTMIGQKKFDDADEQTRRAYGARTRNSDFGALMGLLRDPLQERIVVERVEEKAAEIRLHPLVAAKLFEEVVFPSTLKVEALQIMGNYG